MFDPPGRGRRKEFRSREYTTREHHRQASPNQTVDPAEALGAKREVVKHEVSIQTGFKGRGTSGSTSGGGSGSGGSFSATQVGPMPAKAWNHKTSRFALIKVQLSI